MGAIRPAAGEPPWVGCRLNMCGASFLSTLFSWKAADLYGRKSRRSQAQGLGQRSSPDVRGTSGRPGPGRGLLTRPLRGSEPPYAAHSLGDAVGLKVPRGIYAAGPIV